MHFSNITTTAVMALGAAAQTITSPPKAPEPGTLTRGAPMPTTPVTFCAPGYSVDPLHYSSTCLSKETWAPTTVTHEATARCVRGGKLYSGMAYPCMEWSTPTPSTEVLWYQVQPTITPTSAQSIPQWSSLPVEPTITPRSAQLVVPQWSSQQVEPTTITTVAIPHSSGKLPMWSSQSTTLQTTTKSTSQMVEDLNKWLKDFLDGVNNV